MALFTRQPEIELTPIEGHEDLALVDSGEVEGLLDSLAMDTFDYADTQALPDDLARALETGLFGVTGLEAATNATVVAGRAVARIGYMARVAEWERVPAARKAGGWMCAGLRGAVESSVSEELRESGAGASFYDALGEITAFFVAREPLDVPYDAQEGLKPMWTVPGMGGDFRALLRDRTLEMALPREGNRLSGPAGPIDDASFDDLQRVWKYGFLLRAFEEFFREE
ncbi:MAG TPA: hypothetical protein VH391_02345 [Solirubrobacterales bacterium]|jgi:hypothetical protein